MSTTYPTSKQTWTNPSSTDKMNNPAHSTQHSTLNDTVEALQDQLGITGARTTTAGLKPAANSTTAITVTNAAEDTTLMTFDTTNNAVLMNTYVAIGRTTYLAASFTVDATQGEIVYIRRFGDTTTGANIKLWKARGTEASPTVSQAGDYAGYIRSYAYGRNSGDTANDYIELGNVLFKVHSVDGSNRINSALAFTTAAASSADTIKMYIDHAGNVGINNETPAVGLHVGSGSSTKSLTGNTDAIITGKLELLDDAYLIKEGTADAGTQYDSRSLILTCSVWDTTNTQAEDHTFAIKAVGGSGTDGNEPSYYNIYDNSNNIVFSILAHPTTPYTFIPYALAHLNDADTSLLFTGDDTIKLYAGGRLMMMCVESTQDTLYLGADGDNDVDVVIGRSGCLQLSGETKRVSIVQTGTMQLYSHQAAINDDAYFDLPSGVSGFGMANFNLGAEYAFFSFTNAGVVTLAANSANVANSQSDGNYCIYQNGTNVRIENKIGTDSIDIKVIAFFN